MPTNMDSKNVLKDVAAENTAQSNTGTTSPNSMDDPAFRIIMVLETSNYLKRLEANQFSIFTQKFHKSISKTLNHFEGSVAQKDNNTYLVLFTSVTSAVLCALKIQANFKYITPKFDPKSRKLNIGMSVGVPVMSNEEFTGEAITAASLMCEVVADQLVVSSAVKALYESENRNAKIDKELIRTLKPWEEQFLTHLMEYSEKTWNTPDFNINTLSTALGLSTSQRYRKIKKLTGKSPNAFIREFRLQKALSLLHKQFGNVSEIASASGFNSSAYFSKCFMGKFGILPSKYAQQHSS